MNSVHGIEGGLLRAGGGLAGELVEDEPCNSAAK